MLSRLQHRVHHTQSSAFAAGTKANYQSHLNSYLCFCIYFSLVPFPLSCINLLPFLQLFSESVSSYQYVSNVLSTLKCIATMLGHNLDTVTTSNLSMFMAGLKRNMGNSVCQKLPLTPQMLLLMSQFVDMSNSFHLCVWSAILFMFFTFFRKSNVMPDSSLKFDSAKQVTRGSILIDEGKTLMIVKVTWSKTIQYSQRILYIPVCHIPGSTLCPVKAFAKLCELVPVSDTSPAFVYCRNGKVIPLVYKVFVKQLRHWLTCIGIRCPNLYSSHSLRRGGATWAFQSGVSPELIKLQGDWQSDCYSRYINVSLSRKMSTSNMMAANILRL